MMGSFSAADMFQIAELAVLALSVYIFAHRIKAGVESNDEKITNTGKALHTDLDAIKDLLAKHGERQVSIMKDLEFIRRGNGGAK